MITPSWNIHPFDQPSKFPCDCGLCKAEKLIRLLRTRTPLGFGEVMVKAWAGGYVGELWEYGHVYVVGSEKVFSAYKPTVLGCLTVIGYDEGTRICCWIDNPTAYRNWITITNGFAGASSEPRSQS